MHCNTRSTDPAFNLAPPAAEQPAFSSHKRAMSTTDTSPNKQAKKAKPALNVELTEGVVGGKGGKSQGAKGKGKGKAIRKTSAMKDAEVAAAEAQGDPDHLTHVEQVLANSGAKIILPTEIKNKKKEKEFEQIEEENEDDLEVNDSGDDTPEEEDTIVATSRKSSSIQEDEGSDDEDIPEEKDTAVATPSIQKSGDNDDKDTLEEDDVVMTTSRKLDSISRKKSMDKSYTSKDAEDEDINMTSPTQKEILQGASQAKDGIVHGKAMGNTLNMADYSDYQDIEDVDQVLVSELGKVKLYMSSEDLQTVEVDKMKPLMGGEVPLLPTIKPILELLGGRYKPIKAPDQCLYVLDNEGLWIVKGDYDNALKENTPIKWKKTENGFSLTILVSTFNHILQLGSSSLDSSALPALSVSNKPPLNNKDLPKISQEHFLELLDIDSALIMRKSPDKAIKGYADAKTICYGWPTQFQHLTETDIVNMFMSKSSWHIGYKHFTKATGFAIMYDWLEDNDNALGDTAVWGYEKAIYLLQDYNTWIVEAERIERGDTTAVESLATTSTTAIKSHKKKKQTKLGYHYALWPGYSVFSITL
ncbi:hypothetical protein BDQ12DRAFT_710415 [Crucibulum laeve]|uniref:Uncharacterized protein n=1 Tax=Crucibulum laeve TaxID=68775 RepID=A0A5C3MBH4_9AGAR|nr:hypothetical protein BDQ12DRAFT_710415 [Crucibulum laeve]